MTFLYFILALGVLIFIHELGHFLVAKRAGVRVETFSLGFGPKIFGIRRGETLYKISLLPLGGYVKLTGEDPSSEDANHPGSFSRKSLPARFGVVFAGPVMNLVLALVLMPLVFMMGRPVPVYLDQAPVVTAVLPDSPAEQIGLQAGDRIEAIDGALVEDWSSLLRNILIRPDSDVTLRWQRSGQSKTADVHIAAYGRGKSGYLGIEPLYLKLESTIVDQVSPKGSAAEAGVKAGDRVVAINGKSVATWNQMSKLVQQSEGKPVALALDREGRRITVTLEPTWDKSLERYLLGVQKTTEPRPEDVIIKQYPFWGAIVAGTQENLRLAGLTLQVVGRLVTFQLSYKSLGGPIRIAQASAAAAQSGAADFLFFMAFLSMQLGILNLLPIPVLDGGHLFFMGIEAIRRKPVSQRVQGIAIQMGLFLLLFVMLIVTINDINVVWDWQSLLDKVKAIFS